MTDVTVTESLGNLRFDDLPPLPAKGLDERRLQRVVEFIDDHLDEAITVERLAAAACLSQFHFSRAFKLATGRTPHQYLSEERIRHARLLLAEGEQSLVEVALSCGFASQASFAKAFHRAAGTTPGHYRDACRYLRRQAADRCRLGISAPAP